MQATKGHKKSTKSLLYNLNDCQKFTHLIKFCSKNVKKVANYQKVAKSSKRLIKCFKVKVAKGLKKSPKTIQNSFERLLKVYSTHKILQQKCKNSCKRLQKVTKGNKKYVKKLLNVTNSCKRSTKCIEVQVTKIHKRSQSHKRPQNVTKGPKSHKRSQKVTKCQKKLQKV